MTKRVLVLTGIFFLSCWVHLLQASRPGVTPRREPLFGLSYQIGDWDGRAAPPLDTSVLAVLGADDYVNRVYRNGSGTFLGLYIGYHLAQTQGDSIHSPMNCLPGAGWVPINSSRTVIAGAHGVATVNRVIVERGDDRQLVLYWYQSQGRIVASEYTSKAYLFVDALRHRRTDAALVRLATPITESGEEAALAGARKFGSALLPLLPRHIPD